MKDNNLFQSNGSLEEEVKTIWETLDKHLPGIQQSTSKNHPSGSRRKRFLSYPRFVELMVTADAKMVRHHGRNLEHYILTIMSVVSKMFSKLYFTLISGLLGWSNAFWKEKKPLLVVTNDITWNVCFFLKFYMVVNVY